MTTKEKALGRSGLIIIGSIIGIMFIIGVIGYISGKVSNPDGSRTNAGAPDENAPAPDFSLKTTDNNVVKLSDYRGKVVFLNFWATWCPPCKMELPSMEKLSQSLKDQPFVILAVNVDESDPDNVRLFAHSMGLNFTVLIDDGSVSEKYRVNSIPTTFIIKKDGIIDTIVTGARPWNEQGYVDDFYKLIHEPYKKQ